MRIPLVLVYLAGLLANGCAVNKPVSTNVEYDYTIYPVKVIGDSYYAFRDSLFSFQNCKSTISMNRSLIELIEDDIVIDCRNRTLIKRNTGPIPANKSVNIRMKLGMDKHGVVLIAKLVECDVELDESEIVQFLSAAMGYVFEPSDDESCLQTTVLSIKLDLNNRVRIRKY
ncbi:MAG: hypothetical protein HKN09_03930 [Saprospiraceae bacterium]|nr:hypothetical protein [Saprospiraceae bacterium]